MMTDTGVEPDAWGYLIVCVPIVVIFAPLGSILSSHFHRQVLATLVYILDTVALITALVVIPLTLSLGIMWYGLKDLKMFFDSLNFQRMPASWRFCLLLYTFKGGPKAHEKLSGRGRTWERSGGT